MADENGQEARPTWARRIRSERAARGWSQTDAVRALRAHAPQELPADGTMIRNWKRWEAGDAEPDDFYRPLIAKTFGTVTGALFPSPRAHNGLDGLVDGTGMDTLEVVSRLRASDVSSSTLDALRATAERLCSEYPRISSGELRREGRSWLLRFPALLGQGPTLAQHREVITQAGWGALHVG